MQRSVFLIFLIGLCCLIGMAESGDSSKSSSSSSAVHIVYTERPQDEQPEAYHIRTLASVLGSEEAAKEALIYSYKTAASGFSAKLTPEQVAEMSREKRGERKTGFGQSRNCNARWQPMVESRQQT